MQITFEALERKARYGHRQYIYWFAADGSLEWLSYSRNAIKQAILSVGAKGRFYILDSRGSSHIAKTWRMMVHYWRCAPKGGAA